MEHRPEALFFDLFGTVFDWRTSVTETLESTFENKLKSQSSDSKSSQAVKAIKEDGKFWPNFAQGTVHLSFPVYFGVVRKYHKTYD